VVAGGSGVASSRDYLGRRLEAFLDEIASPDPLPGGGAVAAIAVAMAAGLVAMAARFSRDTWPEAKGVVAQAETLRSRVSPLAEMNAEAYAHAFAVLRERDASAPERRDETIAAALDQAAQIPLEIGESASDVAALAALVAQRGEPTLRADAAVAALLALAGARAAATLVEVNLATSTDDQRVERARRLAQAAAAASEQALAAVA
jgi:methenyltetrahydrofolate cyclohydrolase